MIAAALGGHGWDVWWDREIPLGKAFDEIIEKAIAEAKCVIVLWSAASVASEWVRNEASEGKRRGILVPVLIEQIDAPLAFRSLNGADLSAWSGHGGDAEFVRLVERVSELLGQAGNESFAGGAQPSRVQQAATYKETQTKWALKPWVVVSLAIAVVGAGIGGYLLKDGQPEPQPKEPITVPTKSEPGVDTTDMEKRIHDLVGTLGGAIPATSLKRISCARSWHAHRFPDTGAERLHARRDAGRGRGDGSRKRTTHGEVGHPRRRCCRIDRR